MATEQERLASPVKAALPTDLPDSDDDPLARRASGDGSPTVSEEEGDALELRASGKRTAPKKKSVLDAYSDVVTQDLERHERGASGLAQGMRDVGASIQNIFGGTTLGGLLPTPEENKAARDKFDAQSSSDPVAGMGRLAGQTAGTAPLMAGGEAAMAPIIAGAKMLPYIGKGINFLTGGYEGNKLLSTGSSVIGQGGRGYLQGAGGMGLVSSASDDPILEQMKAGGNIGATLSLAIPGMKYGVNAIRGATADAPTSVRNKLMQAFARDGIDMPTLQSNLDRMGPEATVMDAAGVNTLKYGDVLANMPGEAAERISTFLDERHASQGERLMNSAAEELGISPDVTYQKAVDNLIEQRKTTAKPLYEEAFKSNQNVQSKDVDRVLATPAGKKALQEAAVKMQNDMALMGVPDAELAEQARLAGTYEGGGISSGLKLRTLDYVKRSIDDQIGAAQRAGEKDQVRILADLKKKFVNALDEADITGKAGPKALKPEGGAYKRARQAYSDDSQSLEAIEFGKNFVKNGGQVNAKELANMSEKDKQFARVGVAQAASDIIQNVQDGADAVKRFFGSPKKRAALEPFFPSKEAFYKFAETAKTEAQFAKTRRELLGNSRTFSRFANAEDAGVGANDLFNVMRAGKGDPHAMLNIGNRLKSAFSSMTPEKANEATNLLLAGPKGGAVEDLTRFAEKNKPTVLSSYINKLAADYGIVPATLGVNALSDNVNGDLN